MRSTKKKLKEKGQGEEDDEDDDDDDDDDEDDDEEEEGEQGNGQILNLDMNIKSQSVGYVPKDNEHITIINSDTREQDRYLPVANIARIMKTVLPGNAKVWNAWKYFRE
jgi:hypothetical protein